MNNGSYVIEGSDVMEKNFAVNNLDCAHCGQKIEDAVNKLDGVDSAVLNFPMKKMKIRGTLTDELIALINKTARAIEPDVEIVPFEYQHGREYSFEVRELCCAHCAQKIEDAVNKLDGVDSAILNFPMKKLKIKGEVTDELIALINETARAIEPDVEIVPEGAEGHSHDHHHDRCDDEACACGEHVHEHSHAHGEEEESVFKRVLPLAIGAAVFIAALICDKAADLGIVSTALYIAAYVILGYKVMIATFKNIKAGNFFDENFLMTVATVGAFAIGEYSEAVGVMLFFGIGEIFEDIAVERSRKAITDVAGLKVVEADILVGNEFVRRPSEEIKVGDIIRVKTGERIAADGVIESGASRVDTSAVNGEPMPVEVGSGSSVMSGYINLADTLTVRATANAGDSMMARIADAVEDASASKPKINRFITRFAKVYTPIVICAAVLTAMIPSLITGEWSKWVHSALTFLVISCPCALVLSVPLAYFSGIGAASRLGILFKGGSALEALSKVKAVAFDKTGTLTNGSFTVTEVTVCGDMDERELLKICGSAESTSTHPVAQSIVEYCKTKGIELVQPESSGELAGHGVTAEIGGAKVICGNERLMAKSGIAVPEMNEVVGGSVVYLATEGRIDGRIVVSDTVRKTSAEAVRRLGEMGIYTEMLTGDKDENAQAVGSQLGLGSAKGGLMPDGKLEEIVKLREKYGAVMFIGDGINDGPVLAGADVGGAMHTGSDLALDAADVVLMNNEPVSAVRAKKIADRTNRTAYQNIALALGIKAIVLIFGLLGHPNMWLAVFADTGTAMLCILNSIRLLGTNSRRYM